MRKVHGNEVCKPEGKVLFGTPICRRRDGVEMELQVLRYLRREKMRVTEDRETRSMLL
jgi:hypothetical protein